MKFIENFHHEQHIPFCMNSDELNLERKSKILILVVMQPHTIINQTLHSYCKEQMEYFKNEPMFINLTQYDLFLIFSY